MKVARQFIAWCRCEKWTRPLGYGMIGSDRRATTRTIDQPRIVAQTVPYGTDSRFDAFQAINCLATIISPSGTTNRQSCPHSPLQTSVFWTDDGRLAAVKNLRVHSRAFAVKIVIHGSPQKEQHPS